MESEHQFRFLIAAGGTGGHLFPALAVVERLTDIMDSKSQFWFVGSQNRIESKMIPGIGYPYRAMPISGFTGISFKTMLLPFKIFNSMRICQSIIRENKIDAVICTGAYISYPAGLAAAREKVPLFLLESNVNPGKAIKMLSKYATRIFTSFDKTEILFNDNIRKKIILTGNPLRKQFYMESSVEYARKKLGINPDKPTVLIFGGSLGAMSINRAIEKNIEKYAESDFQVVWQTGNKYQTTSKIPDNIKVTEFINDMATAYNAADLVVSRSGATSTAEICQMSKPSVLIPLPSASNNEQEWNARALAAAGAAIMLNDNETSSRLYDIITKLMSERNTLKEMSNSAGLMAKPNAADDCAMRILELLKMKK